MQPDLARIAFVSRRFNELKGLPTVVAGALLLCVMLLFSRLGGVRVRRRRHDRIRLAG